MNKPVTPAKKGTGIDFSLLRQPKSVEKSEAAATELPRTAILAGRMEAQGSQISQLREQLTEAQAGLKLDPKMVKPSQWANRNELSFKGREFEELKAEIASSGGNVQPIKVRPIAGSSPQEYEVVFGHRRHRACRELGLPLLAVVEALDDKRLFTEMERENRQRADLRPFEQGQMYARALDLGLFPSLRRLAEELGVDVGNVSKYVALARLPAPVVKAFQSPLDLKQAWAAKLNSALEKNADFVLAKAKEIQTLKIKPPSADVFKLLVSDGVVSNNTIETIEITGASSCFGVITWNGKKSQIHVTLSKVDRSQLVDVQKAIQRILG